MARCVGGRGSCGLGKGARPGRRTGCSPQENTGPARGPRMPRLEQEPENARGGLLRTSGPGNKLPLRHRRQQAAQQQK